MAQQIPTRTKQAKAHWLTFHRDKYTLKSVIFRLDPQYQRATGAAPPLSPAPTPESIVEDGRRGQRSSTSLPVTWRGHLCKQGFRGFKGEKGEPGQPGLDGLDAPCQLVQYSSLCSASLHHVHSTNPPPPPQPPPPPPPPPQVPAESLTPSMAHWHALFQK